MKRIAYVGLSSPIAYNYHKEISAMGPKHPWSWCALLESPYGLMTLFDEIWFLHPSLCPITMKDLPFVKFIMEDSYKEQKVISIISNFQNGKINESSFSEIQQPEAIIFDSFNEITERIFPNDTKKLKLDVHSHSIEFPEVLPLSGNSFRISNLIIDYLIANDLSDGKINKVELITNSLTEKLLIKPQITPGLLLSEELVLKRILDMHSALGPIVSDIEYLRESKYLIDFRKKMLQTSTGKESLLENITRIEEEYKAHMENLIEKEYGNYNIGNSIMRVFAGTIAPGSPVVKSFFDTRKKQQIRWSAFLAELDYKK